MGRETGGYIVRFSLQAFWLVWHLSYSPAGPLSKIFFKKKMFKKKNHLQMNCTKKTSLAHASLNSVSDPMCNLALPSLTPSNPPNSVGAKTYFWPRRSRLTVTIWFNKWLYCYGKQGPSRLPLAVGIEIQAALMNLLLLRVKFFSRLHPNEMRVCGGGGHDVNESHAVKEVHFPAVILFSI